MLGRAVVSRNGEHITIDGGEPDDLNRRLVEAGIRVTELVRERRTLEEVFLEMTESSVFA